MLQVNKRTYLQAKEAADLLGIQVATFHNLRSREGDRFLRGHRLIRGRVFFDLIDVERVAAERAR